MVDTLHNRRLAPSHDRMASLRLEEEPIRWEKHQPKVARGTSEASVFHARRGLEVKQLFSTSGRGRNILLDVPLQRSGVFAMGRSREAIRAASAEATSIFRSGTPALWCAMASGHDQKPSKRCRSLQKITLETPDRKQPESPCLITKEFESTWRLNFCHNLREHTTT
jgi:hypothetical protein